MQSPRRSAPSTPVGAVAAFAVGSPVASPGARLGTDKSPMKPPAVVTEVAAACMDHLLAQFVSHLVRVQDVVSRVQVDDES